ncbi:hypothetical protein CHGG_10494 [Chaetomium globosum CBS 148.51]|uniref:Pathway-specific nitrogen regulator n=1 Tax=Chaetomium globosum (strain ATCC 6205 / CBS 148.51 / DSM 1962 / NBRC 6347 / NRRL 1970) TaxID=306901 RepID=Q2GNG0_CHAGB|nr:uncharacterized protein CHGG_10494 [Chaetomium globosum CBS 148.51]EAQ84090.1 hypothetical protein CHGG_10494 [Chaetomium globosum CBS 148.51]
MPRKTPELDLDFNIFVDPSCLSAPMDDETFATMPPSPEEVQASAVVPDTPDELGAAAMGEDAEQTAEQGPESEGEVTPHDEASTEEQPEPEITEQEDVQTAEPPVDEPSAPEDEETERATATEESSATAETETDEPAPEPEQFDEPETATFETEPVEEPVSEESVPEPETQVMDTEPAEETVAGEFIPEPVEEEETEHQVEQAPPQEEVPEPRDEDETAASAEATDELEETNDTSAYDIEAPSEIPQENDQNLPVEDVDTSIIESDMDEEERGRQSDLGDRKTSLRTEALIQAAARAVVAKIEKRKSGDIPQEEDEVDNSLVSTDSRDTYVLGDDARSTTNADSPSRRQSSESHARHMASRSISSDDAGDSSSHNERDDDVFSDRSARSSLYSLDQHDSTDIPSIKTPQAKESVSRRDSYASSQLHEHSSARTASNFSAISGLSQYDDPKLTFVPTHRETRMPFRTPSEIRAMHMTSPTPSVFNGSSPSRSSAHKHHHHHQSPRNSGGPPSSISRLGSPTVSAQYSPKGRSTPPRFKSARKEAPLVLLHVTLLPLRWVWGDVLNTLDSVLQPAAAKDGPAMAAAASSPLFEPSDPLKTLRDAWRELQDRVGDTVLERGILLPHPQNDYEVLEERLLEALELPLRRRARILECGHYVGPANVPEDGDSDDEGADGAEGKTHWCGTCCGEIRCEDLGVGRVFRIKVYASNGLMRAGAWEACWKEMERVDVEVEPIVDLAVQSELEKLAVLQMELDEQRRRELDLERMPEPEPERKSDPDARGASRQQGDLAGETDMDAQRSMMSSPAPSALQLAMRAATPQPSASNTLVRAATPSTYGVDASEERRLRDEERMREIYGDTPPPPPQQPADQQKHQHQQQQPQQHHYPPPPQQQPQQQQPQQQQQQHAFPPPLPLLTDGSSSSSHHHQHHQDPYRRPPVVLDENAGFVDLLTQAFKVLLRDPKNVAIILLCVFLAVVVKRPGVGEGVGEVQVVPPQVVQVQVPVAGAGMGEGYGRFEGGKGEAVEVVAAVEAIGGGGAGEREREVEAGLASSRMPEVAGLEGVAAAGAAAEPEKDVVETVEEVQQQQPAVVEEVPVVVEEEVKEQVVLKSSEADAQKVAEHEVQHIPRFELPADMCPPRGPEYPITMADETPAEEQIIPEAATDAAATEQEQPAGACGPNSSDSDTEEEEESVAAAAPTSTFLPGPLVTERTTVRVFETVTQTVRVSVVTQTETVSTVVTAVPQTVEETVYETETVRITVSVPVDEQQQQQQQQKKVKAKPAKGCQEKGGGWF